MFVFASYSHKKNPMDAVAQKILEEGIKTAAIHSEAAKRMGVRHKGDLPANLMEKYDNLVMELSKQDYLEIAAEAGEKKKNAKGDDKIKYDKMELAALRKAGVIDSGEREPLDEGKDEGKPGKNFQKIANKAAKEYGSKEAGERVAGAIRANLAKKGKLEESKDRLSHILELAEIVPVPTAGFKWSAGNGMSGSGAVDNKPIPVVPPVHMSGPETGSKDIRQPKPQTLEELSVKTLSNYINGAVDDLRTKDQRYIYTGLAGDPKSPYTTPESNQKWLGALRDLNKKSYDRRSGISLATKKLVKKYHDATSKAQDIAEARISGPFKSDKMEDSPKTIEGTYKVISQTSKKIAPVMPVTDADRAQFNKEEVEFAFDPILEEIFTNNPDILTNLSEESVLMETAFGAAFKAARAKGAQTFVFNNKSYNTRLGTETDSQWKENMAKVAPTPLQRPIEPVKATSTGSVTTAGTAQAASAQATAQARPQPTVQPVPPVNQTSLAQALMNKTGASSVNSSVPGTSGQSVTGVNISNLQAKNGLIGPKSIPNTLLKEEKLLKEHPVSRERAMIENMFKKPAIPLGEGLLSPNQPQIVVKEEVVKDITDGFDLDV